MNKPVTHQLPPTLAAASSDALNGPFLVSKFDSFWNSEFFFHGVDIYYFSTNAIFPRIPGVRPCDLLRHAVLA